MAVFSVKNKTYSRSLLVGNAYYVPPIPVEYLVIAGGGAGGTGQTGGQNSGGGGAGGLRTNTSSFSFNTSPLMLLYKFFETFLPPRVRLDFDC